MKRHIRLLIAVVLIAIAAYLADIRLPTPKEIPELNGFYKVMQVHDADTISVLINGERQSVRLLGIDSPEVDTRYTKAECYGKEASAAARTLLDGQMVRIETDPTQDMYDIYNRLLAYVYLPTAEAPGGILVNEYFVDEGVAREYTFQDAYVHQSAFKAAEIAAKETKKGLWGACTY